MPTEVYQLVSSETSPVTLEEAKAYLRISSTADDAVIQSIIDACTEWGESYTRRSFRAQTWKLLLDGFASRQSLRRQPVDAITSITHLVSGSPVTVSSDVYYLKQTPQGADVVQAVDESWPTDTDDIEQAVVINFTTAAWARHANLIQEAILRHVAAMYANRGDCMDPSGDCSMVNLAATSGTTHLYDMLAIARV